MAAPTASEREHYKKLKDKYSLTDNDFHVQYKKDSNYVLWVTITRSGIEKIQSQEKIDVTFEHLKLESSDVVMKGHFTHGQKKIETYSSASSKTTQSSYYVEIAEKRCLSRGVLKIIDEYSDKLFGKDEMDNETILELYSSNYNYILSLLKNTTYEGKMYEKYLVRLNNLPMNSMGDFIEELEANQKQDGLDSFPSGQTGLKKLAKKKAE